MLVKKRANRPAVALARRRQQRPTPPRLALRSDAELDAELDAAMYATWRAETQMHADRLDNRTIYPAMADSWGTALAAARAGDPLEGQADAI